MINILSSSYWSENREVEAQRRRRPDAAPSGGRERAEAPRRQADSSGRGYTGGGSGAGGGGGFQLPGGKGPISIGTIILIVVIAVIVFGVQQCGGIDTSLPNSIPGDSNTGQITSVPTGAPFTTSIGLTPTQTASSGKGTWLVMMYQDADDQVLEQDICLDVNEAEKAGSSDRVKVVAQLDRYNGAYSGDGNWTGTKRFLISKDDNLGQLRSQEVAELGEVNMSSGKTLVDFATWAIKTYPADRYALILSDHGMGWPGGWSDSSPKGSGDPNIPLEARLGDMLYLNELDDSLGQIRAATGLDKFDLVGLDACLMAQLEVFTALQPHARYAVASQEVEPSLGWAYTGFLQGLVQNPDMDGGLLGRLIVESYVEADQRILDSGARADLQGQGSPFGGLFGQVQQSTPEQLVYEFGQGSTLTAVDLGKIGALNTSLNKLVFNLQQSNQQILASSRTYAQNFTSVFGDQVPPSYIDLGNFLQILEQKGASADVTQAANAVLSAIKNAVVAEKHGSQKPGSTGIAIYFPNSQLYQNAISGAQSYTAIASRFVTQSLWDDFLAFHYSGRQFAESDARAVVPASGSVRAPATGGISISAVRTSASETVPGTAVTLRADISGENIGYIYLFAGFYDTQSNSIFVADRDYLESSQTRQVNGVYYPDWGKGAFTLKFNWEPIVFAISDGTARVPALLRPEDYSRSPEEAVYTVDGVYTYRDSGNQLQGRLYFMNGLLRHIYGFTGDNATGAPREITPSAGDKFTISENWLDLDSSGKVSNSISQPGDTLTFGSQMFTWKTLDAAAGDYVVGFVVEDLDGMQQEAFTRITVR
jgi:hypothetical protein